MNVKRNVTATSRITDNEPVSLLFLKRQELARQSERGLLPIYKSYGLISEEQYQVLRNDITFLFLDNIADTIQLVFSVDGNRDEVLLQYKFTETGIKEVTNLLARSSRYRSTEITLDLYIDFTPSFLGLDKDTRRMLLKNTELEWHRD
nr:hypothetical protein [Desulfobulbaceae bacterium]